ncbi:MAG: signal recognition particle-docking protein FtsY [Candidatus Aminicenantes bacterium]|nr:MAG: signal recognition particle-docking protein FtsY [Candidatus Aminicenantes bacterium]
MLNVLKTKLSRTRNNFKGKLDELLKSGKTRDDVLEGLTESLILADVGVQTTEKIVDSIRTESKKTDTLHNIQNLLKKEITEIFANLPNPPYLNQSPGVLIMVGVNGGGKTTSLAKLAHRYQQKGKNILMVAADTFRAAAQEQLTIWGKRLNIPVLKGQYGADPASVVYDAVQSFKAKGYDHLMVDTAGRIHTNVNLMNELEKIRRVISREIEGVPQEILLVLDASIGQNALLQAKQFLKFSGLTGIFLTKLDGTAKGGSVISIVEELKLPIKFVGIGETEKDILDFSPAEFVDALLS